MEVPDRRRDFYLSSPSLWNGIVNFGSGDGNIYALDANSGALKWKFPTGDVVHSSPTIADGMLYIGSYAVDAASGKKKWSFSTDGSWVNNSAVVHEGKVYFGTSIPGILYALDAKTGTPLFQLPTGTPVFSSMAIANATLYMGNFGGKLTAIDLKTQKPVWVFSRRMLRNRMRRLLRTRMEA